MLKTRIITALVLLAVLLPVLYLNNFTAFGLIAVLFFGAATWESFRLFQNKFALPLALALSAAFAALFLAHAVETSLAYWFLTCVLLWLLRFTPTLALGLPPLGGFGNTLLSVFYAFALVGCFAAIVALFQHGPLYLLSVMALVWIADIGAYCAGKAFGKRKLAPSISPGKSWEGAIGGALAVLVLASLSVILAPGADTFPAHLQAKLGWGATLAILLVIAAASVVGDLFESMLKRRVGFKDSSNLLPGHGGVLDRIDALIPVLPLAALVQAWL
ncbi:phosphatidate cytidylyltransferase [Oxalobacteraceae bacterium GrIS 1.11]